MDMNPFKPLIQHCADCYGKILSIKEPLNNLYLITTTKQSQRLKLMYGINEATIIASLAVPT